MSLRAFLSPGRFEAGCDEVGRGCLAGPVVASAVILPPDFSNQFINDSKLLTPKRRDALAKIIKDQAIDWAIASVSHTRIDEINILNASFLAMTRAVEKLKCTPAHLLIDGNRFTSTLNIPHTCIIKGDRLFLSIAAASILAKTYRDNLMEEYHAQYPDYGWNSSKGYPTPAHRAAIKKFGPTPLHRKSFRLLPKP